MNNVLRKISSTTFGIFMWCSAEQPQRSPLWVRLFAHAAHQIGEAGYDEVVSFLTTISIEIFSKCISRESDNNQVS